jgi:hypothetical protein
MGRGGRMSTIAIHGRRRRVAGDARSGAPVGVGGGVAGMYRKSCAKDLTALKEHLEGVKV